MKREGGRERGGEGGRGEEEEEEKEGCAENYIPSRSLPFLSSPGTRRE